MAKKKHKPTGWTKFKPATVVIPTKEEFAKKNRCTLDEAQSAVNEIKRASAESFTFKNNRYQVSVAPGGQKGCVWLSIKRLDRKPIHDWRDLQRIKNELVGPENEAVELYPAESRRVDTANQYHLWVFKAGEYLPLGFNDGRHVGDEKEAAKCGAKQRPFEEGEGAGK